MKTNFLLILFLGLSVQVFSQLGTPSISSPANGSTYYVGSTIYFSWTSVTDAVSYDVEFDTGMGYSYLTNVAGTGLSIQLIASNAGPHAWHVRARNASSTGAWSSSQNYTVIGIPGVPTTVSPATESTINYNTATNFTWNAATNATGYKIQFDSDPVIIVAGTSYPKSFTSLGNHTWKVLASNPSGESSWSSSKNFTVVLATPALTSPANAFTAYVSSTINFSWTPVSGATSYDIEIDPGLGYATLTNVTGTSMNLLIGVAAVGPHTWHVRAKNNLTNGIWSSSRSYIVVDIPAVPTTNIPQNGATVIYNSSTNFNWNAVTNATSYQIMFDSEPPITVTGTFYARTFSSFGNHTWKVLASNDAGVSGWSTVKTFTVDLAAPPLNSPPNGTTSYVGTSEDFTWTSVGGASSYDIEFDAGLGSASLTNVSSASFKLQLTSTLIGQHSWHVRAKNGSVTGPWSQSRSITVAGIPGVPVKVNPPAESSITYDIAANFTWNQVQYATSYQIQFDAEAPLTVVGNSYSRTFNKLGIHTWKVKAINAAGESDWSTVSNFTVVLGVPILSSPANNSIEYVGSTISFSWSSVAGATSYDIEFDSGLGTATLSNISGISTKILLTTSHAGSHTWHVRAKNGSTDGAWSLSRTVVVFGIPAVPVTTSPASGSTVYYDAATSYTWNPVPGATSYKIQFDSEAPITVSGTSYTRAFSSLGNHTWKVNASNDAGESDWSVTKTFIVDLAVPTLSSPANAAVTFVGTTLNFTWTSVAGATTYDIEFDAGQGSVSLSNVSVTSKQWELVVANIGNHTWHVRARNGSVVGQWSQSRTFTVAGIPGIPVTINPPNDGTVAYGIPANFNWNFVPNATEYLVQFDSEPPFTVTGTFFSKTFSELTSHTWKVKAVNPAGESGWSIVKTFTVVLGTPNLTSPANTSVEYVGSTIEFSWTSVAGATSYDIEFDSGLGYSYISNVSGTSLNMPLTISNIGSHTWHVRAKLNNTTGSWSVSRTYQVAGIPAIPITISPANGSTVSSEQNVTFTWNGVANATDYQIQFDSEAPITDSGTSYTRFFTSLGIHTWKVQASNEAGESGWSIVKTFTVELGVPTLTSPANASSFYVKSTINFAWTPVTGATSYDVEFDSGMGYVSLTNVTGTSLTLLLENVNAGPHTWHVRAKYNTIVGSWSATRSYQVIGIPSVPVLISPSDGSAVPYDTAINFLWNASTNATGYQIQFDSEAPITVSGTSYRRSFATQGNHTWKVLATNASGNSDWSIVNAFTMALGIPLLTTPADAASFNVGSTINFLWTAVTGATSYDIEFDNGTKVVSLTNVTGTSLNLVAAGSSAGLHTWHVRARLNATTTGDWSLSRSYTIYAIPSVPVLVSPASNSTIPYNTPTTFTWNVVPDATGYKIQFDAEAPIAVSVTSFTRSFTTLGSHTWKVLATNSAGDSDWSTVNVFNVELGIPILTSPANSFTYFVGSIIGFSWTPVSGATSYDVEFDTGMQTVSLSNVSATSMNKLADATGAGSHSWHVRAKLNSIAGQWSASQSYSVLGVPGVPVLSSPANGSTIYSETMANFTWNAVATATSYQIQFDAEPPVIVSGTTYARTFNTVGNHVWKVLASNAAGNSDWSIVNSLTMALGVPTLTTPTDAASINVGSVISFSWTSVTGATSYDVEFDADMPTTSLTNVSGTSINKLTDSTNAGFHTWHVRAKLNSFAGQWSASQSYSVLGLPAVPVLSGPANASIIPSETMANFTWNVVGNTTGYQIQFDAEPPVTVSGTTYTRTFNTAGIHNWKVLATNAAGNSDWSTTRTFFVSVTPPVLKTRVLSVSPENSFDYGLVTVNNKNYKTFSLQNTGNAAITVSNLSLTGLNQDQFNLSYVSGSTFDIAAGATSLVTVGFNPTSAGSKSASLNIASNADNASPSKDILLSGIGTLLPTKTLSANPDALFDYGNVKMNSISDKNFTIQNIGTSTLSCTGFSLSGFYSDQFMIISPAVSSFDVPAGGNQQITVRFKPSATGIKIALLTLTNNSDNTSPSKLITLVGTGIVQQIITTPVVNTSLFSIITSMSTTGGGNVTSDGGSIVTAKGLCWSKTENPTIIDSKTTDGTGIGSFISILGGLTSGTVYHARAYATNSEGTSYGTDVQFTIPSMPKVTTLSASIVTATTAVISGNVTTDGGSTVTAKGLCWSILENPSISDSKTTDGTGIGSYISNLTGLTQGTTYHARAYATNSEGTSYGADVQFNTPSLPKVTTLPVSNITSSTAVSGGNVTSDGGSTITSKGLCWSMAANPTIADSKTTDGTDIGTFASNITGLAAGVTYHARAYATNSVGTAYGTEILFSTQALATVTTASAKATSSTAAISGGDITTVGSAAVTAKGVCWSKSENPTISDSKTMDGTGIGLFTSNLSGLTAGTTYHIRAYATNSVGTSYGADVLFATPTPATVTTVSAAVVSSTTAIGKGDVTSDGGTPVTQKGLCWGIVANPATSDAKTSNGNGTGSFSDIITGLAPGGVYHVRAYAINSAGTSYGADIQFNTLSLATVVTSSVTASPNSSSSATGKGNVTSDGGASVTEKGFCWAKTANPTVADSRIAEGTGIGTFTDIISGLSSGTTYHIRAYATNAVGTSYGADLTFETVVNNGIFNISSYYHIYPNPTHGTIKIRILENVPTDMKIYSLNGILLISKKLLNQETTLDLNLQQGTYIIDLRSDKITGSYKIIVQ